MRLAKKWRGNYYVRQEDRGSIPAGWNPIAIDDERTRDIVPIKMYEYMAMGKPVITTKLPGVIAEFGGGHGVVYVDKPEDALWNAVELIESGRIGVCVY